MLTLSLHQTAKQALRASACWCAQGYQGRSSKLDHSPIGASAFATTFVTLNPEAGP